MAGQIHLIALSKIWGDAHDTQFGAIKMFLSKIGKKIAQLTQLIENPQLIQLWKKNISIDEYLKLNQTWLIKTDIKTILDIGANVGQFASLIHEVLPSAMIYSFEPLEDCYKKLQERMRKVDKFKAFNIALGDANGELTFHRNEHSPSSSVLPMTNLHKQKYPHAVKYTVIKVKSKKLDDFAEELKIVDNLLIKVDVQGFEGKVIAGGKNTIRRAAILILETSFQPLYIDQPIFEDIYDSLKKDFRYMGSLGEPRMNWFDGSPLFEDSIFVRR